MASFRIVSSAHVEFSEAEIVLLNRLLRIVTTEADEPVQLDQRFTEDDLQALDDLFLQLPADFQLAKHAGR